MITGSHDALASAREPTLPGNETLPDDTGAMACTSHSALFQSAGAMRTAALKPGTREQGEILKRPTRSDCKSDGTAFGGSNPPLPTTKRSTLGMSACRNRAADFVWGGAAQIELLDFPCYGPEPWMLNSFVLTTPARQRQLPSPQKIAHTREDRAGVVQW